MTFGEYLRFIRMEHKKTLRAAAGALDVTPAYLSYVESGKSAPMTAERIEALSRYLVLTDRERETLYDKAAQGSVRKRVPEDCVEYIRNNPEIVECLRMARVRGEGRQYWRQQTLDLMRRSSAGR